MGNKSWLQHRFFFILAVLIVMPFFISGYSHNSSESWDQERARRLAALEAYLVENQDDFDSFRTAPLAIKQDILNFVGMSMIVFQLLPEIFPEIWGPPEDQMALVGFGSNPFDPDSFLPLGIGFALSETFDTTFAEDIGVNYATFTCMACHSGGYVNSDGELIRMIGAPNPLGDYFGKVNQTVNDPKFTAETFRTALNEKPLGWVYGFDSTFTAQEELERVLFNAPGGAQFFLEEVKIPSIAGAKRAEETLDAFTYNIPNPPLPAGMPGSLDVFGLAAILNCNPNGTPPCDIEEAMPLAPAPSDIMAVWQMDGRPRYQWDDSISQLTYREVAASLTVSGSDPASVNLDNVLAAGSFTDSLPAYPYPFDVDVQVADRGAQIFQQSCASCHALGNNDLMTPEETGTSPNRANVFTENVVNGIILSLRAACTLPECFDSNGQPLPDSEILQPTGSYIQIPLVGVWATAPYLHNGSVPTLYHLLTNDRPDTFYRGNFTYDQELVGYTWAAPTNPSGLSLLYDTSLEGYSNAGHSGPEFNGGIDWEAEPQKLLDLLEYLKTL